MAILVYFATTAAITESLIGNAAHNWGRSQQSMLLAEIPLPLNKQTVPDEMLTPAINMLENLAGVSNVREISAQEKLQLLSPWLKGTDIAPDLPMPVLLEITLKPEAQINLTEAENTLKNIAPGATLESSAGWLQELISFTRSLSYVALLMLILTGLMLVIAISLICQAGMAVQQETLVLLHTLGTTDKDIARLFEAHTKKLAVPAAFTGFLLSIITFLSIFFYFRNFLFHTLYHNPTYLIPSALVLLVPILAVLCSTLTARFSALRYLRNTY